MSRKSIVLTLALLMVMSASSCAQEPKTQEKQPEKQAAQQPAATQSAAGTQASKPEAAANEPSHQQSEAKEGKQAGKDQGAAKATSREADEKKGEEKKVPKDIIILKGAPLGGVKFLHTAHSKERKIKCDTCHHPSKTEKPSTAAQQACTDCHTPVAKAPMKTKLQAAFHNPTATAGICIDCHKAENAKGKNAPTKCMQCHKKTNV